MSSIHLATLLLYKGSQTAKSTFSLLKVQNQAKLIYSVRNQNSGYLQGDHVVTDMKHEWGFGKWDVLGYDYQVSLVYDYSLDSHYDLCALCLLHFNTSLLQKTT